MPIQFVVEIPGAAAVVSPPAEHPARLEPPRIDRGMVLRLEGELRRAIRSRAHPILSETRALKKAFQFFDDDASGEISFDEFLSAMERFGLCTDMRGRRGGAGGVPSHVARALFDRFDVDRSGVRNQSSKPASLQTCFTLLVRPCARSSQ